MKRSVQLFLLFLLFVGCVFVGAPFAKAENKGFYIGPPLFSSTDYKVVGWYCPDKEAAKRIREMWKDGLGVNEINYRIHIGKQCSFGAQITVYALSCGRSWWTGKGICKVLLPSDGNEYHIWWTLHRYLIDTKTGEMPPDGLTINGGSLD